MSDSQANEIQQQIIQMELFREQAQIVQEQLTLVINSITQLTTTLNALNNLRSMDDEIHVSLGTGTYVKAELIDKENVLMHIGADILSKKSIAHCVENIESNLSKLEENKKALYDQFEKMTTQMETMRQNIQQEAALLEQKKE